MFLKTIAASALLASSFFVSSVSAAYDPARKNNTAVYWGQNGAWQVDPTKQTDLFTTCNNPNVDIVIVSFVTKFKGKSNWPIINLSNQCGGYLNDTAGKPTDILYCPTVGQHITACQAIGKKVLLSLGGATYTDPGWADTKSAQDSANSIWAMFGPVPATTVPRPFASAIFDGFDLDFEHTANAKNAEAFALHLTKKIALDKKRKYLLTAAPQCFLPDATLDKSLTTVPFDAIFIQFYNNPCSTAKWTGKGKAQTTNNNFNLGMWQTWATTKSYNKNVKLFVGFISGEVTPNQIAGYVSKPLAQRIVADSMRFANFAGASFWDSSILNINKSYLPGIVESLNNPVAFNKRDVEAVEAVEERDIKTPVGGATDYAADDFVEVKVPADAFNKFKRRRHLHHRGI